MKVYQHIVFWLITAIILTMFFGRSLGSTTKSFFFVTMVLPIISGTSYFFNYYLVPKFLLSKHYFKFGLYTIYMLIISMYLEMLVITVAFIVLANYSYSNMSVISMDVFTLTVTLYFVVFFFSFILLVRSIFSNQENIKFLEIEKKKNEVGYLNIRANRKNNKILFEDIEYIESMGDYVKIVVSNKEASITKEKISKLEKLLPTHFIRVHRSFIINMNLITSFNKEEILLGNAVIPISRTYKKKVADLLMPTP